LDKYYLENKFILKYNLRKLGLNTVSVYKNIHITTLSLLLSFVFCFLIFVVLISFKKVENLLNISRKLKS